MNPLIESDEKNFDDWEDDDGDEEQVVKSLFDDTIFATVSQLLDHHKQNYNFDLKMVSSMLDHDDIAIIMLVNFIRSRIKESKDSNTDVDQNLINHITAEIESKEFLTVEKYMIPVLQNDPLLFTLRDALVKCGVVDHYEVDDEIDGREVSTITSKFLERFHVSGMESGSNNEISKILTSYQTLVNDLTSDAAVDGSINDESSGYFSGYSHISIHETMLRDIPRTSSYSDALIKNSSFLKGKVVLDVGCGTGILCMLAVRAGAKKVIGVDLSSIIEKARKVIERNGMSDKITLVRGRMEDVKLPLNDDEDVDVIVSEWMGYGLYFENMLTSVLFARDEYLADDGILMPSDAELFIEAMTTSSSSDRVAWWSDVYGFNMTDMTDLLITEAQVQSISPEFIISNRSLVHQLNIKIASVVDLDFVSNFSLVSTSLEFNQSTS